MDKRLPCSYRKPNLVTVACESAGAKASDTRMGPCKQFGLKAERFAVASQSNQPCALPENESKAMSDTAIG